MALRMSAQEFAARFPRQAQDVLGTKQPAVIGRRVASDQPSRAGNKAPRAPSILEAKFALQVRAERLPAPQPEFRFASPRKWAFDFAWPEQRLAVEVEGGTRSGGRHVRPQGFQNDCEKYNAASQDGWLVLRYTAQDIQSGAAINQVQAILKERQPALTVTDASLASLRLKTIPAKNAG